MEIFEVVSQDGFKVAVVIKILKKRTVQEFEIAPLEGGRVLVAFKGEPKEKKASQEMAMAVFHKVFPGVAIKSCEFVKEV